MDNIRLTEQKMLPSNDVTADEYWKGSFGVNHSDNQVVERIVIKVYGTQVNYVHALPIHESQKELESNEEFTLFEYHIVLCYNLYQQLLWHREKLEIVEPIQMREEMAKIVRDMTVLYKERKIQKMPFLCGLLLVGASPLLLLFGVYAYLL